MRTNDVNKKEKGDTMPLKTRRKNLIEKARHVGLQVATWSPGDGMTRYRFFRGAPADQDYFGPLSPIGVAYGISQAHDWVNAFKQGHIAALEEMSGKEMGSC